MSRIPDFGILMDLSPGLSIRDGVGGKGGGGNVFPRLLCRMPVSPGVNSIKLLQVKFTSGSDCRIPRNPRQPRFNVSELFVERVVKQ